MLDDCVAEVVPAETIHLRGIGCLREMAQPGYELQRGEDGVRLQRPSEHPELDGVLVGDVHRTVAIALGVSAHGLGLLGPAAVRLRCVAARGPSVDLFSLPAREVDDGLE